MKRPLKATCTVMGLLVLCCAVLSWPVGTWLQGRELTPLSDSQPDVLYIVAGSREQDRRIAAAAEHLSKTRGPNDAVIPVLIGNDVLVSKWSKEDQRNLTVAEWSLRKTEEGLGKADDRGQRTDDRGQRAEDGREHQTSNIKPAYARKLRRGRYPTGRWRAAYGLQSTA